MPNLPTQPKVLDKRSAYETFTHGFYCFTAAPGRHVTPGAAAHLSARAKLCLAGDTHFENAGCAPPRRAPGHPSTMPSWASSAFASETLATYPFVGSIQKPLMLCCRSRIMR